MWAVLGSLGEAKVYMDLMKICADSSRDQILTVRQIL